MGICASTSGCGEGAVAEAVKKYVWGGGYYYVIDPKVVKYVYELRLAQAKLLYGRKANA